jgi:hypothetical protein
MPEVVLRFPEGRYEGEVDGNNIPDGQGLLEFPGNDELERQLYEGASSSVELRQVASSSVE